VNPVDSRHDSEQWKLWDVTVYNRTIKIWRSHGSNWDVTPHSLVDLYPHFGGTCYLRFRGSDQKFLQIYFISF
jgi:hypothetical protein